jgi:hypothetical protein
MSENIDINIAVIKEEVSINAANNLIQVNINSAPISIINPQNYDLSQFTNTSPNPFVQQSALGNYVPTSRTLTINGTTQDLSTDRSWTISTGLTIGTTPIASGTIGRVLFEGTGNVLQESANLFWDNTNIRLGVGTGTPTEKVHVFGGAAAIVIHSTTNESSLKYNNSTTTATIKLSNNDLKIELGSSERARIFSNGNVLIQNGGTFTDAGFRLDVNGTARVQNTLDISNTTISGVLVNIGPTPQVSGFDFRNAGATNRTILAGYSSSVNVFRLDPLNGMVIGGSTINASALIQMDSTTKGFLPPRMTTTQRNAIASPAAGLIVYDTTLNLPHFFNGTIWVSL